MFDHWKLKDFAPGEGRALGVFAERFIMDDEWIAISAPGDVYEALMTAGRIQDRTPFTTRMSGPAPGYASANGGIAWSFPQPRRERSRLMSVST